MTGPKLNEASFVAGERSGTKASALYIRSSASKIREVLNLIRGLPVREADELHQLGNAHAIDTLGTQGTRCGVDDARPDALLVTIGVSHGITCER